MKEMRIKDICSKGSSSLKQKDVEGKEGKYPVFGASGQIGKIDSFHQKQEYIAIVKDGSGIGRVSFMPAYSSVIGTLQYILPKEGFNIKYISYCLQSLNLAKYKQGAAIPHIYFRDYGEYLVKVNESLSEQERIVAFLDAEFEKIDQLKANAAAQLQAAKDLFQAALKEMLTPNDEWEEKKLGEVVGKLVDGSHNPPKGIKESSYRMLSSRNIENNNILVNDDVRFLSKDDFDRENKRTIAQENDVVLTIVGTIGRSAVLSKNNLPITFQRSVAIMSPLEMLDSRYLMYFFRSSASLLNTEAQGVAQKGIYLNQLRGLNIKFPPLPEQQRIAERLDAISEKVKALQSNYDQTLTLCNDLKQALLKSIFA